MKIYIKIFLILVIFSFCTHCKKGKKIEIIDMDKLVLQILTTQDIPFSEVKKGKQGKSIVYQIPLNSSSALQTTDKVLAELLFENSIFLDKVLKNEREELSKVYIDKKTNATFVFNLYTLQPPPPVVVSDKPQLCIIVDDFGNFDGPLIDAFCQLDLAVTFAILPGLPFTKSTMDKAVKSGREVIVHIPMEAENPNVNPGSNAIFARMSDREIYDLVRGYFREIHHAKGANQHMGSLITADRRAMRATLRFLSENDYFFIDSRTTPETVAREIAREYRIPFEERKMFLDAPENTDAILRERIEELRKLKDTKKRVLVITHCHDRGRLDRLKTFIEEAKKMGYELVPASQFVQREPVS
jgi:hypothetical protein